MRKRVLIADPDKSARHLIQRELEKHDKGISVFTAEDGLIAIGLLKKKIFSLVISDIKMPRMDGILLLAYVAEHFPDIPVMLNIGYGGAAMGKLVQENGAVDYLEKPIDTTVLLEKIEIVFKRQSSGGTLRNISTGTFLQMMKMENRTCMVRVYDNSSEEQGILFVRKGQLIDARSNGLMGQKAVFNILAWEDVTLSIQNDCPQFKDNIQNTLEMLLLESMRRKDEATDKSIKTPTPSVRPATPARPATPVRPAPSARPATPARPAKKVSKPSGKSHARVPDILAVLKGRLEQELGDRCGLNDIYKDSSWNDFIDRIKEIESFLDSGKFKVGFINKGESNDYFLLPGEVTTVISVNSQCMRDKMMTALNNAVKAI